MQTHESLLKWQEEIREKDRQWQESVRKSDRKFNLILVAVAGFFTILGAIFGSLFSK